MEASSLFRPRPFHALFRPHRLPGSAPRRLLFPGLRVLSPQGLSSGHIAFPAPTPGVAFFTGLRVLSPHGLSSGHIAFPAPTPGVAFFSAPAFPRPFPATSPSRLRPPPASSLSRPRRPSVPAFTCSGSSCFPPPLLPPPWFVPLPAFGRRPDCPRAGLFCPLPAPKSVDSSVRKRRKYLEKRLQNPIL